MSKFIVWYDNPYATYMQIVETKDIYKWIGKKVCNSVELVFNFRYVIHDDDMIKKSIDRLKRGGFKELKENKLYCKVKIYENS